MSNPSAYVWSFGVFGKACVSGVQSLLVLVVFHFSGSWHECMWYSFLVALSVNFRFTRHARNACQCVAAIFQVQTMGIPANIDATTQQTPDVLRLRTAANSRQILGPSQLKCHRDRTSGPTCSWRAPRSSMRPPPCTASLLNTRATYTFGRRKLLAHA